MREIKKKQLEFLDWELGVFFHFGMRTFYDRGYDEDFNREHMPIEGFLPTELDCEQWVRTAKEGGAKYAIFVCNHPDGFATWPSAYTDYSVANAPWKDGNGDVVKEFTDACRKYDMKIGLYYGPTPFMLKDAKEEEIDDYFIAQISELMSNYGEIDYLWLDGCGCENHKYDIDRIVKAIRALQPNILFFNMWDPDTRWPGNEAGLVQVPNFNVVSDVDFSIQTKQKDVLKEETFLPAECDCRIRLVKWFYSEHDADTLKSVDELLGLYYYSVGRGANLLLNIAPDRRGLLPEKDAARFIEFGKRVQEMFANSLAGMEQTSREENTYTVDLGEHTLVNHVVLQEVLEDGNHIEKFSVYIYPYPYGERVLVYQGTTVGHKQICHFPTIRTPKIDIVIEKERGSHTMKDINVYYC